MDGVVQNQSSPSFTYPQDIIGRHCRVQVGGKLKKFKWLYDGKATDVATGISASSGGWKSHNGAKKHALEELCRKLHAHFEPIRQQEKTRKAHEEQLRQMREAHEAQVRREREAHEQQVLRERAAHEAEQRRQEALIARQRESQKQQLCQTVLSLNQQLQEKLAEMNERHAELNRIEGQIGEEQSAIEEFKSERNEAGTKVVTILGHTGGGKSTVCNRWVGDRSLFGNKAQFATSGKGESCTQDFSKATVVAKGQKIVLVDTPGFGDTFGRDREHGNLLCKYLRGCGGINNVVLVRNAANVRFDEGFQKMLEQYHNMFGDMFFERMIILASRVDSSIHKQQFDENEQAKLLQNDIREKFKLKKQIPVIPIGLEKYEESLQHLVKSLRDDRVECEHIRSPIDDLRESRVQFAQQYQKARTNVEGVKTEIKNAQQALQAL